MAGRKPIKIFKHSPNDRINAAKLTLRISKFNACKCALGIEALRQYRQEWNEKLRVFRDNAEPDWSAHGADAFGYLSMAWKMLRKEIPPQPKPLFIPTQELTIADYISYGDAGREKRERV